MPSMRDDVLAAVKLASNGLVAMAADPGKFLDDPEMVTAIEELGTVIADHYCGWYNGTLSRNQTAERADASLVENR